MKSSLFDAKEVVTGSKACGNSGRVCFFVSVSDMKTIRLVPSVHSRTTHIPLGLTTGEGGADFFDLEPVTESTQSP